MAWRRIPNWLKKIFPQLVWEGSTIEKYIYLTFDDGPTPGITSQVLALLNQYKAKATFFCLGSQVEKHPDLFEQIKAEGHTVGNHGYRHLNGFFSTTKEYVKNAQHGASITESRLFRPPYGRITPRQIRLLKNDYQIVMWSMMSMDFRAKLKPEQCYNNIVNHIFPGAIIVFHDTEKAAKNVFNILSLLLDHLDEKGYRALTLNVI